MTALTPETKILIVGLGLLGGSYAQALSKKGFAVKAITRSRSSIDFALEKGWIVDGTDWVDPTLVGEADLIVFCLYPKIFVEWLATHQHLFKPGAVLTDVTGVKESLVKEINAILRDDVEFIAAHPMAGREVYGVENADDRIFSGANYVVTPTEANTPEAIALCEELGRTLGFATISRLSPAEHDQVIAFVSQLTHCIAVSLMTCQNIERLEDYTGDSFRDLTRIARLNEDMWSELFLINRDALLHQITLFESELIKLRGLIETRDTEGLKAMMRHSTVRRAIFDKKI